LTNPINSLNLQTGALDKDNIVPPTTLCCRCDSNK